MRATRAQKRDKSMTYTESHDTAARVAAPGAPVAPPPPSAKNGSSQNKGASQRPKRPAGGKTKAARKKKSKAKAVSAKPAAARQTQSKGAQILAMIERSKGATLAEIQKTTGWQPHSVRGFLSTAAKKHNLQIESTRTEGGDRLYRVQK